MDNRVHVKVKWFGDMKHEDERELEDMRMQVCYGK